MLGFTSAEYSCVLLSTYNKPSLPYTDHDIVSSIFKREDGLKYNPIIVSIETVASSYDTLDADPET